MIQRKFNPQKLNLLLMFQVNCPGCFVYALPIFNELYEKYHEQIGFIALSTAFEDYDLNTVEHTKALVDQGELVGETKKALAQRGIDKLPYELQFPIGMDAHLEAGQYEELAEQICHLNPNYPVWAQYDQDLLREKVMVYLKNQDKVSLTFTANQFRGTPTIALFNDNDELLNSWFGHQPVEAIIKDIERFT